MPLIANLALAALALAGLFAVPHASAQEAQGRRGQAGQARMERSSDEPAAARPARTLPADRTTQHSIELAGRSLRFAATAGSIPLTDSNGRLQAEMAYVAYTVLDAEPRTRPVTFAFNGGPGSASAWLHLGVLGPWRLPLDAAAASPSAPPTLSANAETWLDFTDLVLLDPIGTGYSRFARTSETTEERRPGSGSGSGSGRHGDTASREVGGARYFWSVGGDIDSISDVIAIWLRKSGRLGAPKYLAGESYGGFRGPKIAHTLQSRHGIGLSGLVLVSPVLDFTARRGGYIPMRQVTLLPSLAAATLEQKGMAPTRALLKDAETYARGDYLADLMRGPRDADAIGRIVPKVAAFTGLAEPVVRRHAGRIDAAIYDREVNQPRGRRASAYDASVTGYDPDPAAVQSRARDPFTAALAAPLTGAMLELYAKLGWQPDGDYRLSNGMANGSWNWGNSPNAPEAVSELKAVLSLDPRLKVLVVHGFTDLVTPYLATELILDQIPAYGDPARLQSLVYPGGHMFYSREASRRAFKADALRLYGEPDSARSN